MSNISITSVAIRFICGGGAVLASTLLARIFGGRIGGIFAAFPAVYLAAILSLNLEYHGQDLLTMSQHVSHGALIGMIADIICAVAASYFIMKKGWQKGLTLALVVWIITASGIYFAWTILL